MTKTILILLAGATLPLFAQDEDWNPTKDDARAKELTVS